MPHPPSRSASFGDDGGSLDTRAALLLLVVVVVAVAVCGGTPAVHALVTDAGLFSRTVNFAVATVAVAAVFLAVVARRR